MSELSSLPCRGSAREVKAFVSKAAYPKLRNHFKQKDWQIVGWGSHHIILRVERENVKFDRHTGNIKERFKL